MNTMNEVAKCELCGEPMPPGEEMFLYHGYSGPCLTTPTDAGRDGGEMSDLVERCRTARYSSNDVREAADEIIRLREKNSRLLAANKDLQAWFDDARDECEILRADKKDAWDCFDAARKVADGLRKDAERYRFLLNDVDGFEITVREEDEDGGETWVAGYPPEEIDAAIDAAMLVEREKNT